jgi:hypothetical protein
MFSLDQLVEEHHSSQAMADPRSRADAERFVRAVVPKATLNWHTPSITMRFALVAANLSRRSGAADTMTFYRLKEARDRMLHGAQSEAPDGATSHLARDLALRYNRLLTIALSAGAMRP